MLSADNESCTVLLNKNYYVCKVDEIIDNDIAEGKYMEANGDTMWDLKRFQDFLSHPFYKGKG